MNLQFLKSHLTIKNGYGEHARSLVEALSSNGFEVIVIDDNDVPIHLNNITLSKKSYKDIPIIYNTFRHSQYKINPEQITIIRTMMETEMVNPNWINKFQDVNAVWVPSRFNFNSFMKSGLDKEKLFVINEPINSKKENNKKFKFQTKKNFKFLSIFAALTCYRKGVDVLLNAYKDLFTNKDDVCLIIKTDTTFKQLLKICNITWDKSSPEVEVIHSYLEPDDLQSLFNSVHSFVLPSRGEGIGMPYLYAMQKALPVIATNWSGNTEFMNNKNSFLIDYKLKSVPFDLRKMVFPVYFGGKLAEPDVDDLKKKMYYVFNDYKKAKIKGTNAKKDIIKNYSYDKIVKQVRLALIKIQKAPKIKKRNDIFYKLFPLNFSNKKDDFYKQYDELYASGIKKIAIYGTGGGGKNAYKWISGFSEIEKIIFCDNNVTRTRFLRRKVVDYKLLNDLDVDIVIIGCVHKWLNPIYKRLIKKINHPIYYFSPMY